MNLFYHENYFIYLYHFKIDFIDLVYNKDIIIIYFLNHYKLSFVNLY